MGRAQRLAARGWGRVAPNPMVGAVIVRDGIVVGEGWHEEYGGPHAEVHAIRAAGALAAGATMYVSLEPCAHHGRTPPCTDAILDAGVRRVVYGASDPNPKAAGGGSVLRQRGLDVEGGAGEAAVRRLNAPFFHAHERGRPYVALKLAQSLDGAIAAGPGARTQITGPKAQAVTQRLRAGFDAILVGANTVRIDDPLLTVRGPVRPRVAPARVILDRGASLSLDSRLIETIDQAPVHVVHGEDVDPGRLRALADAGVTLHAVPATEGGVAPDGALRALWDAGLRSLLCEGGARLAASLLQADRVERAHLWISPVVLGDGAVRGLTAPLPGRWRLAAVRRHGPDALLEYDRLRDGE